MVDFKNIVEELVISDAFDHFHPDFVSTFLMSKLLLQIFLVFSFLSFVIDYFFRHKSSLFNFVYAGRNDKNIQTRLVS